MMMPGPELDAIACYFSLRIVSSLAEGTVICVFAGMLLRRRGQNATTRFAIALSTLIAIAVMPLASALWPQHAHLSAAPRPAFVVSESWALYLFWTWAVLASCLLLAVGRALWHLHRLRQSCAPVDPSAIDIQVHELVRDKRVGRKISLCTSEKVRVPTAIGLTQPTIILPAWVLRELSASELKQVVLHELTHLRRWDDWTTLAQQIVKALFFFHPAVWWIEKKLALEREMACDDAVLAETSSPRAYAECLAHLAERSFVHRSVALAHAALGHVSQVSRRVAQILDGNRLGGSGRAWKPAATFVASFALVCAVGVAEAPTLIAFEPAASSPFVVAKSSARPMTHAGLMLTALREPTTALQKPVLTKFREPAQHRPGPRRRLSARRGADSNGLVHMTALQSAPITQTFVVFISTGETNSPDQQAYQIQVWRFTVLRSTVDPSRHPVTRKAT